MNQVHNHPHLDLTTLRSPIEPSHKGRAQRLVEAAERTGFVRAARGIHDRFSPAVTILAYHRVTPTDALDNYPLDQQLISATPTQFEWQMRHIRQHLNPISLRDVITHLDTGMLLPSSAVVVTFDDGFADTYRYAFPILKRYAVPATIFVSTGYVDSKQLFWFELTAYLLYKVTPGAISIEDGRTFPSGDSHNERTASLRKLQSILKDFPNAQRVAHVERWVQQFSHIIAHDAARHSLPISWNQVHEMASAGIEFGSHTITHPNLTRLSDQELNHELVESKRLLEEHVQHPVESLAYPIGTSSAFDKRVTHAAQLAKFKVGVTYVSGANPINQIKRFELHRHGIGLSMTPSYFRALTSLPSWLD